MKCQTVRDVADNNSRLNKAQLQLRLLSTETNLSQCAEIARQATNACLLKHGYGMTVGAWQPLVENECISSLARDFHVQIRDDRRSATFPSSNQTGVSSFPLSDFHVQIKD